MPETQPANALEGLLHFQPLEGLQVVEQGYELARCAAAFVRSLPAAAVEELSRRAACFDELTGTASDLDAARRAAAAAVLPAVEQHRRPDGSLPESVTLVEEGRFHFEGDRIVSSLPRPAVYFSPASVYGLFSRPADLTESLAEVITQVEELLAMPVPGVRSGALQGYLDSLSRARRAMDLDDVWGCKLLLWLSRAFTSAAMSHDESRLCWAAVARNLRAVTSAVRNAARSVLACLAPPLAVAPVVEDEGRWPHPPRDQPPAAYSHGPLTGKQLELAAAVYPAAPGHSRKQLRRAEEVGICWVRGRGQHNEAFFREARRYEEARQALEALRRRQEGQKTPEKGRKRREEAQREPTGRRR
jgi:hypothetical protein